MINPLWHEYDGHRPPTNRYIITGCLIIILGLDFLEFLLLRTNIQLEIAMQTGYRFNTNIGQHQQIQYLQGKIIGVWVQVGVLGEEKGLRMSLIVLTTSVVGDLPLNHQAPCWGQDKGI